MQIWVLILEDYLKKKYFAKNIFYIYYKKTVKNSWEIFEFENTYSNKEPISDERVFPAVIISPRPKLSSASQSESSILHAYRRVSRSRSERAP